jgi:predicted nucleic acid-binding protein
MILIDTGPLVALCDARDALHVRAKRDLDRVARSRLVVCLPVLTEVLFLLDHPIQRERLRRLLIQLRIEPHACSREADLWRGMFDWLHKYADHDPDLADAYLVMASGLQRGAKVWTYDREFRTTWRRLDGSQVPLTSR